MTLADAVVDLVGTFGRDGDRGHLALTDGPAPGPARTSGDGGGGGDVTASQLEDYLDALDVEPGTAIGGVLGLELAGRDDLPRLQEGRAVVHVHGQPRADTSWPASWVVIALSGESAVAVDTSSPACPVRGGVGGSYLPLADSLADWLSAVAVVMRLEQEHGEGVRDADLNLAPAFLDDARAALLPVLGEDCLDGFTELHLA